MKSLPYYYCIAAELPDQPSVPAFPIHRLAKPAGRRYLSVSPASLMPTLCSIIWPSSISSRTRRTPVGRSKLRPLSSRLPAPHPFLLEEILSSNMCSVKYLFRVAYVISAFGMFIVEMHTFDPFRSGRHIYTFENTCSEEPDLKFGDETVKLLLNTRGKMDDISSDLRAFLAYVENTTDEFAENTDSRLVKNLQQRVKAIKDSRKFQDEYMTQYMREQEIHDEAYAEGHASGLAEGYRMAILNMRSLGYDDTFIAQCLGISVDDIPSILAHGRESTAAPGRKV